MEKKGDQTNLDNDRGIFNVSKIRSILDKLIYNDIYDAVDYNMSSSNIGARKSRNIRDHLFVINGILNEAINAPNKQPIDIQIYDVSKCFDKLDFINTANDLYNSGVKDDKFVLVANSNKSCNVSIKLPWGSLSRNFHLNNIEMQGTVLAPLKCSASIDRVGKEALTEMHANLYKYKQCVTIPPLSMIDDILAVSHCSVNSIKINGMIEAKLRTKNLILGEKKCSKMHIGKRLTDCNILTVNDTIMKSSSKEKYLGNLLTNDGKITENITERYNKGLGTVNQILSMLKELHFGKYYFEMALLFRNSILLNGMLFSIEALYGIKTVHLEKLEACDKIFLRKVLNAHSKTAIEALYLETGTLPIRFIIMARRLMFYWSILQKSDDELARQVFDAQKLAPLKNDWICQIEDDLKCCDIYFTENEISQMKRTKFKSIVNEGVREAARKYLLESKESHSKSSSISNDLKLQQYLQCKELSLNEKQLLFRLRTYTYECKANFPHQYLNDNTCLLCKAEDSQEHLLQCIAANDIKTQNLKHSDIFGPLKSQINLVKVMIEIDKKRKQTVEASSIAGSHAHPNPCSGA